MSKVIIRPGKREDVQDVLALIYELAEYEHAKDQVRMTEEELVRCGFGDKPSFSFIVAEINGDCVGMALYYTKFSTWEGNSIFLEDLIISEKHRRLGVGHQLMDRLVEISKEKSSSRLEWQVLNWNKSAIDFYKKYNVAFDDEWINARISFNNS
ncbi:MAG: GNAT superfamily N-acetyltransferase [Patiriisocius sp.]|jgi:GNAT superfamily N-acetyltransferase